MLVTFICLHTCFKSSLSCVQIFCTVCRSSFLLCWLEKNNKRKYSYGFKSGASFFFFKEQLPQCKDVETVVTWHLTCRFRAHLFQQEAKESMNSISCPHYSYSFMPWACTVLPLFPVLRRPVS